MTKKATFWSLIAVVILAIGGFWLLKNSQSNSTSQTVSESKAERTKSIRKKDKNRILIVVFSRKKGVYGGKTLKRGYTQIIAEDIQRKTKGDLYQIKAAKPYPATYSATSKRVQSEKKRNARPKIKGKLPNVKKYDTIFIGSPVWWGEYPMIVRTFLDREPGLNGKVLVPFSTSGGSGLANMPETLKNQFPEAKILPGFTVEGEAAAGARTKVNQWLKKIGF